MPYSNSIKDDDSSRAEIRKMSCYGKVDSGSAHGRNALPECVQVRTEKQSYVRDARMDSAIW